MLAKKIAMLGMWGVGKTSLVQRFVHSLYDEKYHSTLGVKVDKKVVEVGDTPLNLMLWDIAGAEDKFSVPMHYVKGAAGYLLVMDGTRQVSVDQAREIADAVTASVGALPFVPVVNKADLDWEVSPEAVAGRFDDAAAAAIHSSAKTGAGVEEAFHTLAGKILADS